MWTQQGSKLVVTGAIGTANLADWVSLSARRQHAGWSVDTAYNGGIGAVWVGSAAPVLFVRSVLTVSVATVYLPALLARIARWLVNPYYLPRWLVLQRRC